MLSENVEAREKVGEIYSWTFVSFRLMSKQQPRDDIKIAKFHFSLSSFRPIVYRHLDEYMFLWMAEAAIIIYISLCVCFTMKRWD